MPMNLSIQYKLFTAILFAALAVVGYMAAVIQWSFDRGFLEYVNLEEQQEAQQLARQIETYYAEYGKWKLLMDRPLMMLELHARTMPEGKKRDRLLEMAKKNELPDWILTPPEKGSKRPRHPIQRTVIFDMNQQVIFGYRQGRKKPPHLIPIMHSGSQVGTLGLYPPQKISETHQLLFVEKQRLVILLVGIAAVFITIGISLPLAYHLTKPIRRLSDAARALIGGNYATRVPQQAKDELGRLSADMNKLAATLEENEVQRKRWVSDIAHELRTPLTTLRGEIEALQDGIRHPDQRTYDNLHRGVMRLSRLVEDLNDLARADRASLSIITEELDLCRVVKDELNAYQQEAEEAGLHLDMHPLPETALVRGDRQRLQQLIGNLLTNSIRYTDRGGTITVVLERDPLSIRLGIRDTHPGVPDQALPRLFDRLYRVEQSRSRALGGSGLGLAICKQIVTAHQGTITAQHAPEGGLWIQVTLPTHKETT